MQLNNLNLLIPKTQTPPPTYSWGTITTTSPVQIQVDGFETTIQPTDTLASPLNIGDRVYIQFKGSRSVILGVSANNPALSAYPIGAYYWSSDPTSPEELFGGRWESVSGKFVYAQNHSHPVGSTGGSETHRLTVDEMPKHSHRIFVDTSGSSASNVEGITSSAYFWNPGTWGGYAYKVIDEEGGDEPHSIMPPYVSAYCWHRIG